MNIFMIGFCFVDPLRIIILGTVTISTTTQFFLSTFVVCKIFINQSAAGDVCVIDGFIMIIPPIQMLEVTDNV